MNEQRPRVAVIGSGYVGTVVAACLASIGTDVVGVEIDPAKLELLQAGKAPLFEAGLDDLLAGGVREGRLRFTASFQDALDESDVVFLCVGTPSRPDGNPDMSYVESAASAIAEATDGRHVLVTKSTVPIGSGQWLNAVLEEHLHDRGDVRLRVVSNPEFLREGSAVSDFLHPERVVLGSDDEEALDVVASVYRPILEQAFPGGELKRPPLIRTSLATAETVKYAANAFLATKISFINEMANICERVGADVVEVAAAIGLDSRIGPRFFDAGIGWGGSCFGKDLAALVAIARGYGYDAELLRATIGVNERQRGFVIDKLQRSLKILRGSRIAVLGLAFKPGTDDLRDSPAVDVAHRLLDVGAIVRAYDPMVREVPALTGLRLSSDSYEAVTRADAVVLATDWPEFLNLDLHEVRNRMRGDLFLDVRNMFDPDKMRDAGFEYVCIGRNVPRAKVGMVA